LDDKLLYTCQETKPNTAVTSLCKYLGLDYKRNVSGYEFWGLKRPDVIEKLQRSQSKKRKCADNSEDADVISNSQTKKTACSILYLKKVSKTRIRNAGTTKCLKPQARSDRNKLIHEIGQFTSFGDV